MKRLLSILLACALLTVPTSALTFTDTQGHWAEDYISTVSDEGLFYGTGDMFLPNDTMTRGMFITVLGRLAEKQGLTVTADGTTAFTDVPSDAYYADYVSWANANQIISGVTNTQFAPDNAVTREQMCTILMRFLNWAEVELASAEGIETTFLDQASISPYALDSIALAQQMGLIHGIAVDGGVEFQPQASTTRSAVATVFVNLMDYLALAELYSYEEIYTEATIAGYLSTMVENYNNSSYLTTTDQLVQDTMATMMGCLVQSLEDREEGVFLSRQYIQDNYGETIEEMKTLYDQLTEDQYTQFFNVVLRLGSTDTIFEAMAFFGVSYSYYSY